MAKEPERKMGRLYDAERRKEEGKPKSVEREKRDGGKEPMVEGKPKNPLPEHGTAKGIQDDAHRMKAERDETQRRHESELAELAKFHRDEGRSMNARHESEHEAHDGEHHSLVTMHRKHEGERMAMHARHHHALMQMHEKHRAERHAMHGRHETARAEDSVEGEDAAEAQTGPGKAVRGSNRQMAAQSAPPTGTA